MLLSLSASLFLFLGCFVELFAGVLSSSPSALSSSHHLVFFTSGLGLNLTETLSGLSTTNGSGRRTCEHINKDNHCFKAIRTNVQPPDVQLIANVTKLCPQKDLFGCVKHFVAENSLQSRIKTVYDSLKTFCAQNCIDDTKYMRNLTCSILQATGSQSSTVTKFVNDRQVSLLSEILRLMCSLKPGKDESCGEAVNTYYNVKTSKEGMCYLNSSHCSTECMEEAEAVNQSTACCLHSAALVLSSYNVRDSPLQMLESKCSITSVETCNSIPKPTTGPTVKPTQVERQNINGRLVAGIIFSIIISLFGLFLMLRCVYRLVRRKRNTRYEDYGYSQLRMMEESLFDDVEESDDDLLDG